MASHRTLKTHTHSSSTFPLLWRKLKPGQRLRENLPDRNSKTPPKRTYEGLWLVLSGRERETVGCQYRVAPGIGHDQKRGQ
jgi:hypothetical protein